MIRLIAIAACTGLLLGLAGCAGGGHSRVSYGVGYGGSYGPSAWGRYPSYPVYVGGGRPDIPHIPDGPIATPMPDFGMPDMGGGMADFDF